MTRADDVARAPLVLGIVADDLTGATDSSAAFADEGWRVELILHAHGLSAGDRAGSQPVVLAVSTGCRAASDATAATQTAAAVHQLLEMGVDRLYVKIDSTVRGSVAGQVEGALTAWRAAKGHAAAAVCPAFPALGRTVVNGVVLVDGLPVADSPAGRDPVTPRRESGLDAIIPGSVSLAGPADSRTEVDLTTSYDARTDADLARVAAIVDDAGPSTIGVGSGGLAAALARRWRQPESRTTTPISNGRSGALLVAVSSLHPVAVQQVDALRGESDNVTDVHIIATHDVEQAGATADQIAADLADRVVAELAARPYEAIVLVGGDGAAAVLRSLGAQRVTIRSTITTGIPAGVIVGGPADGTLLVTKSGGFGDPTTLTTIARRLRAGRPAVANPRVTTEPASSPLPDQPKEKDVP